MSQPASQETARAGRRFERHSTKHRGISYRKLSDGSRTYLVSWKGTYVKAASEKEALALQGDLRARTARGQRVVVSSKATFAAIAEEWFASKTRVGAWTRRGYRDARQRPAPALRRLEDRSRRRGSDREARARPRT